MNCTSKGKSTLLSILIPVYKYPSGLERILLALVSLPNDIEVLVFDDSPEPDMQLIIARYCSEFPRLEYRHNPTYIGSALGPGENWNSLLDAASGDYVLLMHHDEVPLDVDFVEKLRSRILGRIEYDVHMLNLMLVDENISTLRRSTPAWFRRLIPRYMPNYLFRRNVIGPTGTLVIRRIVAPRFDSKLRWLIDVEFYVKLFNQSINWRYEKDICIGSVQRSEGTITADLSNSLKKIDVEERKYMAKKYVSAHIWLGAPIGAPVRFFETIAWAVFRLVSLLVVSVRHR